MQTYTHSCIKCKTQYSDEEQDAYYCPTCVVEKKRIADAIDKRIAANPSRETVSDLERYNQLAKTRGVRGFVRASDIL